MEKFDRCLMNIAREYARMSTAKRLQVGAVIAKEGRVISGGYNGTPSKYRNSCEVLESVHCSHCHSPIASGPTISDLQVSDFIQNILPTMKNLEMTRYSEVNFALVNYSWTCQQCGKSNGINYDESLGLIIHEENLDISYRTAPEVIHAEQNAILFAAKEGMSTKGCSLYVTHSPCYDCAKMIIQAGIIEVVYDDEYRDARSLEFLEKCGVTVRKIEE